MFRSFLSYSCPTLKCYSSIFAFVSASKGIQLPMGYIDWGFENISKKGFWRAIAAEFLGSVFFLLCVTCVTLPWHKSISVSLSPSSSNYTNVTFSSMDDADKTSFPVSSRAADNIEIGIGIGLAIASLSQAFSHNSGGHLNPAVSLGMIVGGRINVIQGFMYIFAQVTGGVVGTGITYACTPVNRRRTLGVTSLAKGLEPIQGFVLELLFTFMLVFFVFSVTDEKKNVEPYGLTLGIGVVIWVCHVCLIPFTGCGINPARSFGPAVLMNSWKDHWIYWVGPLIGGFAAGVIYKFIFFAKEDTHSPSRSESIKMRNAGKP